MRCLSQAPNDPTVKASLKNLSILLSLLLVPLIAYTSLNYVVKSNHNDLHRTDENENVIKLHAKYDKNSDGFIDIKLLSTCFKTTS